MLSKSFAFGLAVVARHGLPPSCLSAGEALHSGFRFESGLRPLLNLARSVALTTGRALSYLPFTTKPERLSGVANGSSLFNQPLNARIDESQRIVNSLKVVSPTYQFIADFHGSHGPSGVFVQSRENKICPRNFRLNLLSESVLKSYFCGAQLCEFYIQLRAGARYFLYFLFNLVEGLLECLCHNQNYKLLEVACQALF